MNKRGIAIVSVMFGLFALSFGVLGVRALTLGPDPAQPTATELAARETAANTLEQKIAAAKADVPPALPAVPGRAGAAQSSSTAMRQPAQAAYVDDDEQYEEGEEYEGAEYEDEDEDHEEYEHEEGDHDDD